MEVQVFSAAPIDMDEIIIKKDQDSSSKSVELVSDYLENYKFKRINKLRIGYQINAIKNKRNFIKQ